MASAISSSGPECCTKEKVECFEVQDGCPPKKVKCPDEPKPCVDPCAKQCDPCATSYAGWGWFGSFLLWFVVLTILFWLIIYSLKPNWVLVNNTNEVDTGKVLLAAVIIALIIVIIIWLIKAFAFSC